MGNDYPRMLYRFPAQGLDVAALQEGNFDTLIVDGADAHDAATAEGWSDTSPAAKDAHAAELEAKRLAAENAAPTRAELEAKATELGIKFDGRTSDKKLGDQISAALET